MKKKLKLSTNAKKVIILCSMVGLLIVTGVLNFVLNEDTLKNKDPQNNELVNNTQSVETFFSSYRTDRETQRAAQISYLDTLINEENAEAATISTAKERKLSLIEQGELELVLESLIKAKGFEDVVVTIGEENVNVIVSSMDLEKEQVAQILSVILNETTYTASDVVVINYSV